MRYSIHAVGNRDEEEWTRTIQLPTFYLDSNMQGIVSEDHARQIAEGMLRKVNPEATFTVSAFAQS